ncbi:17317_t:CDS:2, partial [Cetraspora pellucida]
CSKCKLKRLSKEFPLKAVSHLCQHIPTWCLEVLKKDKTESNELEGSECPECNVVLKQEEIDYLTSFWKKASFKLNILGMTQAHDSPEGITSETGEFYVVLLNGQKYMFRLEDTKSVRALKIALAKKTAVEIGKQKLIFKGAELDVLEAGVLSNGNAKNYDPIIRKILEIERNIKLYLDSFIFNNYHYGAKILNIASLDVPDNYYPEKNNLKVSFTQLGGFLEFDFYLNLQIWV